MKKPQVFSYSNYKTFLKDLFSLPENRGLMTSAATFLNCGKSYLSRVLGEKMDISSDQGYRLGEFLNLTPLEKDYFVLLVEFSRSVSREYRQHIQSKIENLKTEFEQSQRQGESPLQASEDSNIEYYSYWLLIPLHLSTSFKKGISTEEAQVLFRQPTHIIKFALQYLVDKKWVQEKAGRYYFLTGDKYIPPNHPLLGILHKSLRDQATLNSQTQSKSSLHYSVWYTMNAKDFAKIKELTLSYIQKVNQISHPSDSEMVVGFSLDLFDPFH